MESFFSLSPEEILDSVESAMAWDKAPKATGRVVPLNSIENRVYDIEFEDKRESIIAKFYRPGRWTELQILEEHEFLAKLNDAEIPVVVAEGLYAPGGKTLGKTKSGILFALFKKVRGRSFDELNEDSLRVLGRFVARLHLVGATLKTKSRLKLDVATYGDAPLEFLERSEFSKCSMFDRYWQFADELCRDIEPFFVGQKYQAVHGDCHLGNLLWHQGMPLFVDFDDFLWAPPVQDVWMIAGGRDDYAIRQREVFLEAYEEFRDFDRATLSLIEPLRALRLIHYSAWIARRWEDPSFERMFPQFGGERWWQEELEALSRVRESLENS